MQPTQPAVSATESSTPEPASWPTWMVRVRCALHGNRRWATLLVYGATAGLAYTLAFLLRFDFRVPPQYAEVFLASLPWLLVIRCASVWVFRLSMGRWRFIGLDDVLRMAQAMLAGSVVFAAVVYLLPLPTRVPGSIVFIDALLAIFLTMVVWVGYRVLFERLSHGRRSGAPDRRRVLIVGAGQAGHTLALQMARPGTGLQPIGFVDDDPLTWGTRLNGLEVIGGTRDMVAIAEAQNAEEIVIAVPSAPPSMVRALVEHCEETGLPFRVLPGIRDVLTGKVQLNQLRKVRIEDLLGREPVELELPELAADLEGRTVLITGAAGSIGSELSRQVALHRPEVLVLFDHAETALFYLEMELREKHPELCIVPVVGNVADRGSVECAFRLYAPDRVFHAAAYKHVPMMEENAREAVHNNVLGTWRVADAAGRSGAAKFVLVSTDKAVRPANVMGATKRLAEMVVLELQASYPGTSFSAVRFGNVLGSNGSVIPVFKRQIEAGKPLTVTHPDVTRYFMTIPEAVQLILQSSLLPELRGRIAMLEMGEPVRIVDLARNLLHLSGKPSRSEHSLVFTGLRPGEKLHEELVAPDEAASPTSIDKVRLLETRVDPQLRLLQRLEAWRSDLEKGEDPSVQTSFSELFPLLTRAGRHSKRKIRYGESAVENDEELLHAS